MSSRVRMLLLAGLIAAACGEAIPGPPDLMAELGIVAWDDAPATLVTEAELEPGSAWGDGNWGNQPAVVAPDSVERGAPFTVETTTPLPNGCWYPGGYETSVAGSVATITVYDHRSNADLCTLIFSWNTREIELKFDDAGEALIRLVGRRIAGDDFGGGEEIVIENTLTVY